MRPLVWTNWMAFAIAGAPFVWLVAIELGTSRRVRSADRSADVELDRSTSRLFDLAVASAAAIAVPTSVLATAFTIRPRSAALGCGVALMIAAAGLSTYARRHLGRFHRHALTRHHQHEVVSGGPYRLVRHPIYSATVAAFIGIGLALGNWLALASLAVLPTVALIHRINVEEAILRHHLGESYEAFCHGRARLVPGLW